ncbi:MAG: DUF2807 domain-containing protein [Rhodoferax sp.]|nr:DUF2807 domain-containing protein [Rhodoferax sp.]
MQKLLMTLLLAAATPLAMAAQETRELPAFKSITTQGAYKLVVTVGQPQSVVVSGEQDVIAKLRTKVVDNDLIISMPDEKKSGWKDKLTIVIGVAQLNKFQMEGVGDTTLNQLAGEEFLLRYQGVGTLTANGRVQRFILKAEGVGNVNARDLDAKSVEASLEGIGSAKVRASETLNARVEGIGSLSYYGRPARVTKSADGIGSVRAAE